MNCRSIGELIPLYIEGDLDPGRKEEVRAHLDRCEHCSRVCHQYGESQAWLRSYAPPEFDDAFFDGVRRSVLAGIEQGRARPSFFHLLAQGWRRNTALATAIALLVGFGAVAFYAYRDRRASGPTGEVQATAGPAHKDEEPAASDEQVSPRGRPAPRLMPKQNARPRSTYAKSREIYLTEIEGELISQSASREPVPDLASIAPLDDPTLRTELVEQMAEHERQLRLAELPTSQPEMMRIEIQTGDPGIRIIWFAPKVTDLKTGRPVIESDYRDGTPRYGSEPSGSLR